MTNQEAGFLLLTSQLGNPNRKPLTVAQLRALAARTRSVDKKWEERSLLPKDLVALGYAPEEAERIVDLLEERELLEYYLYKGKQYGCTPVTRVSEAYPLIIRKRLGEDSPGSLWAKGDLSLLKTACISVVGSRQLHGENQRFAQKLGTAAAKAGVTLVSGNARGADMAAQQACWEAGGQVICVVADQLHEHPHRERMLYLSEDSYDSAFSSFRALSRNRVIHCMGYKTFVVQTDYRRGGTWDGTMRNLKAGWSGVYCFADGSEGANSLISTGAYPVKETDLADLVQLCSARQSLFG